MILKVDQNISLELLNDKHAESIFKLINSNRVHLREWLPWVIKIQTIDDFKGFISEYNQKYTDNSDIAFVILYDFKVVGRIGIYKIDNSNKIGSIGYWLGADFQGNGIILKSVEKLIEYCFTTLDLNRIEIKCGTKNFKSQAIPIKLNFKNEGIIRQGEFIHNDFMDLFCFSLLKSEFIF